MDEIIFVVCPFCGLGRPLEKKGTTAYKTGKPLTKIKGRSRLNIVDPEQGAFIDFRAVGRGRGQGLERLRFLTLNEIKDKTEYRDLINQLKEHSKKILKILEG